MRNKTITTKKILEAQKFAFDNHGNKTYGNLPYASHLFLVVLFAQEYIDLIPEEDREAVIIACWLHDVREDAGISYNKIKALFGEKAAEIIYCVTNEDGRTREEKALKTYPKTAQNRLSVFVKLADRLTNTFYSKLNGSGKFQTYKKEFDHFYEMLYLENEYEPMWNYLKELVEYKEEIHEKS